MIPIRRWSQRPHRAAKTCDRSQERKVENIESMETRYRFGQAANIRGRYLSITAITEGRAYIAWSRFAIDAGR